MILKFKTTGQADNHFIFVDGVSDVFVCKGPRTNFNDSPGKIDESCNYENVWWEDDSVRTADSEYLKVSWNNRNGGHSSCVTHLPTYLLNGEGKTIERLI